MFARVFDSAKQILSRSPSAQGRAEGSPVDNTPRSIEADTDTDAEADMVTTRRGTGTDPSVASTPRSSARKTRGKREFEATAVEETPTVTKRRRKSVGEKTSPPKETEEDLQDSLRETIMPDRTKARSSSPAQEDSSRRGRQPRVVISKKASPETPAAALNVGQGNDLPPETPFFTPGIEVPGSVYATPVIAEEEEGEGSTPKAIKNDAPKSISSETTKKGKKSDEKITDEIPSSTWEMDNAPINTHDTAPTPTPATKNTQIRFDSEEPVIPPKPVEKAEPIKVGDEDDSGSDSDEAPEMVTTAAAATKAKASKEDAARARKAQEDKEALKKKQKAERIAEEQAAKRKREEAKAAKLAKRQAREQVDVDMDNVPDLLPASILEAAGDRRPPTPPPMRPGKTAEEVQKEKLNRHIKFLEQSERPIKDVKRGSVNVAVLAKQNALLAPKFNKDTKNIREQWLKGRQQNKSGKAKKGSKPSFKKMERRAVGGGFLRGRDD